MGLFDSSQKDFLAQFKIADWRSEVERKEAVAAVRASGKLPVKGMIQIIGSLHPSESNKERVRTRMMSLEEMLDGVKDPTIVSPMLDLLPKVDAVSRDFLIRILKMLYQKEQSEYFVDYLKSGQKEIREAMSEVLGCRRWQNSFRYHP